MALTFHEHWIYSGSTSVPNALFRLPKLQLTADECLLIAWLNGNDIQKNHLCLKYSRNLSNNLGRRKTII